MALPASYSFTGSENPLATNWSSIVLAGSSYGFKEGSGNAIPATAYQSNGSYWDVDTFDNAQSSKITIASLTNFPGAMVRWSSSGGYIAYAHSNGSRVYVGRINASDGAFTDITGSGYIGSLTVAAGNTLEIKVDGTTISVYLNDSQIGTDYTDSTYTSGSAGIYCYAVDNTTGTISDWEGGNLGADAQAMLIQPWHRRTERVLLRR